MGVCGSFSEFGNVLKTRVAVLPYTAPFVVLTTKHHDILMFGDGGALAKVKEGQREKFK